ncbi:MAG: undecaprenyl-diphosphatase UppP [Candidatus Kerfeldbacteria bacterium]|nr:undecaprenyl-diphosphatase UppP [Candidatus Kerfeldbacteria bacterium]
MSNLADAAVLGALQGLTEFLPISSSGHLLLAHQILGFSASDSLTFDVMLHLGTLLALIAYFWRDLGMLITNFMASFRAGIKTAEQKLPWIIILAAIPAAIAGAFFESFFKSLRSPWMVVVTFAVFGVIFLVVERIRQANTSINTLTWKTGLGIGLAQVLALVPGVSRSGITIVAGMWAGLSRAQAARFTFLLSVPVVAGAAAKKLLDLRSAVIPSAELAAMLIGVLTAAVVGYLVVHWLLRFLANHRLDLFAYYRFLIAAIAAFLLLTR